MPQPLSRVMPTASVYMNNIGDFPLQRHPEMALLIAEVISTWATVEAFMLDMFVDMMGGDSNNAAIVFLALEAQSAKSAAIQAIARKVLSPDNQKLLSAILAPVKSGQKERDKVAHGVWGDSPQINDGVLLSDPRDKYNGQSRYLNIFVYKFEDFDAIRRKNQRLSSFGMSFHYIITGHITNKDGDIFHRLCSEPEIREKLDRQASRERSAPAEYAPPPDAWHQNSCDLDPHVPD
jgi:hypothetical protein